MQTYQSAEERRVLTRAKILFSMRPKRSIPCQILAKPGVHFQADIIVLGQEARGPRNRNLFCWQARRFIGFDRLAFQGSQKELPVQHDV